MDVHSFKKNHLKNLISYALAVSADEDTEAAFEEHVIKMSLIPAWHSSLAKTHTSVV